MASPGLWVKLMKRNLIAKSETVACTREGWQEALQEACHRMDVPRPIVMPKHLRDWDSFAQTRFLPDHFMESVSFDRMEIEFIDPDAKKKINEKYL